MAIVPELGADVHAGDVVGDWLVVSGMSSSAVVVIGELVIDPGGYDSCI